MSRTRVTKAIGTAALAAAVLGTLALSGCSVHFGTEGASTLKPSPTHSSSSDSSSGSTTSDMGDPDFWTDKVTKTIDCDGSTPIVIDNEAANAVIQVNGDGCDATVKSSNVVVLLGTTGSLTVTGSDNTVDVLDVDQIAVSGDNNSVTWQFDSTIDNTADTGSGNVITQLAS